jgi:hypothetical protein
MKKYFLTVWMACLVFTISGAASFSAMAQECNVKNASENRLTIMKETYISDVQTAHEVFKDMQNEILEVAQEKGLDKESVMLTNRSYSVSKEPFMPTERVDNKDVFRVNAEFSYFVSDVKQALDLVELLSKKDYLVRSSFSESSECEVEE